MAFADRQVLKEQTVITIIFFLVPVFCDKTKSLAKFFCGYQFSGRKPSYYIHFGAGTILLCCRYHYSENQQFTFCGSLLFTKSPSILLRIAIYYKNHQVYFCGSQFIIKISKFAFCGSLFSVR